MKKNYTKTKLLKIYKILLTACLAMLGFSMINNGCKVEYGVEEAAFHLKGTIQSKDSNVVIPHIRVVLNNDTTYTNTQGFYEFMKTGKPESQMFSLEYKDIDGTTNGEFLASDTVVEINNPEPNGVTEKEINVKLKRK
jgi:putative lipoprotein (rSAM/lipoprotein system)